MICSDSLLDADYDIVKNGRYEYLTRSLISEISKENTVKERKELEQRYGLLTSAAQPFHSLIFDRHLQIPVDPAHCICQGLSNVLAETTISLMTSTGRNI